MPPWSATRPIRPSKRVDFPDQMALAETADGRIAGHRADGRKAVRDQRRARAHARRRGRGFAAGMPATDHNDIKALIHRSRLCRPTPSQTVKIGAKNRHAVFHMKHSESQNLVEQSSRSNQKR